MLEGAGIYRRLDPFRTTEHNRTAGRIRPAGVPRSNLLAGRSPTRTESFRGIKKALMPKSRVGQFARLPLLKRLIRGCEHPAVNRIEDHDDPGEFLRLLRQFRIILVEQGL